MGRSSVSREILGPALCPGHRPVDPEGKPEIFLLPATSVGSDLAARVAIRINTGLSAHCTNLDINSRGELMQVVPAFGGKVMATILCPNHRPQMATVRPGVYPGETLRKRGGPRKGSPESNPRT